MSKDLSKQTFDFSTEKLSFEIEKYNNNNRTCIRCVAIDGSPYAVLTTNLPDANIAEDEFCIKNWSENTEIAAKAFETGLFVDTGKVIPTGYVQSPVWKLADDVNLQ